MASRVVGRTVLNGMEIEAIDTVCGLVGVTDEVENSGRCVDSEV